MKKWTLIVRDGRIPCGLIDTSNKRVCNFKNCNIKDALLMQFAPDLLELLEQSLEYDRHPDYDFDSYFLSQCADIKKKINQ